nr:hypothetical protein [Deltaproteobacteria bacterium]
MKMHRMFAIALLGAASFNCSAADEGALRSDDSLNAIDDEAVADDVVAVFDADPGDATHQYFELRYVDDGGTVELRGYGEDGQLSRATMRPMFDPDGRPWMRLSIEDEQVAFEGHIRMLSTEAGRE